MAAEGLMRLRNLLGLEDDIKAERSARRKAPTFTAMAPNQANTFFTGLQCNTGDCSYLCLKRSEMDAHHAEQHEGLPSNPVPCQMKQTDKGLELELIPR